MDIIKSVCRINNYSRMAA